MFEEERLQYLENKVYRLEAELKDSKEYQKHLDKVLHEVIDRLNIMNANMINIYAVYNLHHDNSAHMNTTSHRRYT